MTTATQLPDAPLVALPAIGDTIDRLGQLRWALHLGDIPVPAAELRVEKIRGELQAALVAYLRPLSSHVDDTTSEVAGCLRNLGFVVQFLRADDRTEAIKWIKETREQLILLADPAADYGPVWRPEIALRIDRPAEPVDPAAAPARLQRGEVGHLIEQLGGAQDALRSGDPIDAQRMLAGVRAALIDAVDPHPVEDEFGGRVFRPETVWPDLFPEPAPKPAAPRGRGWRSRLAGLLPSTRNSKP